MRTAFLLAAALFAGCRSGGQSADAARAGHPPGELHGDSALEAQLEIADARLVHVPAGVEANFVLRNRSGSKLHFEFLVQSYARDGAALPDGRTAWVLLELGPHEGREVRTATLPAETESWRLVARKEGG
jgi:uncharacterized protein YcfL